MTVSATFPLISDAAAAVDETINIEDCQPLQIVQITNHVAIGLSRLISQYKDKPRVESILKSYLLEVQLLEDAIFQVINADLDNATGDALVQWGKLVGEPDDRGLSEDNYRVVIKARIRVNRSDGHPDDLIEVLQIIAQEIGETPPNINYTMGLAGQTGHVIRLFSDIGVIDGDVVFELLDQADPAGVPIRFIYGNSPSADLFRWSSTTGSVDFPLRGFSSSNTPGLGGKLSSVRGNTT